jgi:DMSO/TMAO reductase YedYZ molybdopterin-dependent catalytic subunit
MTRARLDPAGPFGRHPLQPHQLVDRVTRIEDTIVLCHLGIPRIDAADWSLSIDGLIRRPKHLMFDDIMRLPRVEITSTHQCCGSPMKPDIPTRRICNVVWGGARLSDLLSDCEPDSAARYVWSSGADYGVFEGENCQAFVKDIPIDRVPADVMVAYEMNGAPLRPENGFPARLVVPGYYGTNSVKWLNRLTLADRRAPGPFTTRWYNDPVRGASGQPTGMSVPVGPIAAESVIVSPAPDQILRVGEVFTIWGWAWADDGIDALEVSIDAGSEWMPAKVELPTSRAWQRFIATWCPAHRGRHELRSRARSSNGRQQPTSGARNAIHSVPVHAQ